MTLNVASPAGFRLVLIQAILRDMSLFLAYCRDALLRNYCQVSALGTDISEGIFEGESYNCSWGKVK
jgi:hypothetical protein